jgi:hypothetical protein
MRPVLAALLALSAYCTGAQPALWQTRGVAERPATAYDIRRDSFERLAFKSLKLSDYKTTIHPVIPESGITTGMVFVYGHPIPPPYRVELKDTLVFVNGIQVYPTPKTPEMLAREKARAESLPPPIPGAINREESLRVLRQTRCDLYWRLQPGLGHEGAVDSVLHFLNSSRFVDTAWRAGTHEMWVRYAGSSGEVLSPVPLGPDPRSKPTSRPPRGYESITEADVAARMARGLTGALLDGSATRYMPPGGVCYSQPSRMKAAGQVLANRSLNDEDKYMLLVRSLNLDAMEVAWLIANYSATEWTWVDE